MVLWQWAAAGKRKGEREGQEGRREGWREGRRERRRTAADPTSGWRRGVCSKYCVLRCATVIAYSTGFFSCQLLPMRFSCWNCGSFPAAFAILRVSSPPGDN